MARKRMKSKIQPAVQTIQFEVTGVASNTLETKFIDLSQSVSIMNRRFYRQGLNWAVSRIKIMAVGANGKSFEGFVACSKLPNTWVMSNAWEKAFRAWQQMNNEAMSDTSVKPKFLDFKIYADVKHHTEGYSRNLLPYTVDSTTGATISAVAGEWVPSKMTLPDSSSGTGAAYDRELLAVGSNYPGAGASGLNAVSIIEGYAASRSLPTAFIDPNVPDDAADASGTAPQNWLQTLENEGTQQDAEVLDNLLADNNQAPYPFENDGIHTDTMYPGGSNQLNALQIHDQDFLTGTTIGGTVLMKGGNFPCGLMRFDILNQGTESHNFILQVDLIPGHHRGYLCEPMTEM